MRRTLTSDKDPRAGLPLYRRVDMWDGRVPDGPPDREYLLSHNRVPRDAGRVLAGGSSSSRSQSERFQSRKTVPLPSVSRPSSWQPLRLAKSSDSDAGDNMDQEGPPATGAKARFTREGALGRPPVPGNLGTRLPVGQDRKHLPPLAPTAPKVESPSGHTLPPLGPTPPWQQAARGSTEASPAVKPGNVPQWISGLRMDLDKVKGAGSVDVGRIRGPPSGPPTPAASATASPASLKRVKLSPRGVERSKPVKNVQALMQLPTDEEDEDLIAWSQNICIDDLDTSDGGLAAIAARLS